MARSIALRRLDSRLSDADRLLEIHAECTGPERGRRRGYDALNRSAVILAVAAWEGFVEDRLEGAAAIISRRLKGPSDLPGNVRDAMLAAMYEEQGWSRLGNETKAGIWSLAGRGWRSAYVSYAKAKVGALNTPDYQKLRRLYASVIGLSDVAVGWEYRRWTKDTYTARLDNLLLLRHRIAHGVIGDETVGKTVAKDGVSLVRKLATWTDQTVGEHLASLPLASQSVQPIRLRRDSTNRLEIA